MGIHLLQTFITSLNDRSIKERHLREFSNKKITIDISIYLYRFKEMGNLLENMYLMCSIFRYYNIHPLFIFDGKHLKNKNQTIQKRKENRKQAQTTFIELKRKLHTFTGNDRINIEVKMDELRKQFITVTKDDIKNVKELFESYGITYITATHEADELCGALNKEVHACLTEDTDIMAYGCKRIFRYFSLMKHTVVVYNMDLILNNLNMTLSDFQELCVCSGNDYISSDKNIFYYYDLYRLYKRTTQTGFLEWLLQKRYISLQDYHKRREIYDLYTFKTTDPFKGIRYTLIKNKYIKKDKLMCVLKKAGFIFP
uniref:XPG N-terminal domain-containing protein n=1 Tax=viral metagenome TaxID=1070528 RepID=A0A6C0C4M8_9ZZZZ